jgi:HSP20 family protein
VEKPHAPPLSPCDDLQVLIAKRAHELFSERGYRGGSALDDWLEAEREILSQIPPPDRAAPRSVDFQQTHGTVGAVLCSPNKEDRTMAPATKEKDSTALTIHRPSEIMPRAQEMERWFDRMVEDFWRRPFPTLLRPERWWPAEAGMMMRVPAVDVYEEQDDVVIKAEIPGLSKEDISVQVTDSTLTIKGEKKREEEVKEDDYYRCERSFGSFTRAVDLPCDVKADQVKASFKDGVLEVRMPKTEEAKKKAITVTID